MNTRKDVEQINSWWGLIQIILFVVALITHDWFLLAAVFVMGSNLRRVITYDGDKE